MTEIRILLVDDEPDIREVVDVSLGLDREFRTRACASGADALVTAVEWAPSLILLDVMMPLMDGPTTLANLRKNPRTANIPVVFLTARTQADEIEHFISLGAEGVLSKPFNPMTLAASVRDYLPSQARLVL
jgi:CheY-like chemotaxis protein